MNTSKKDGRKRPAGGTTIAAVLIVAALCFAPGAEGQAAQSALFPDAFHQLNDSVEALVQRVSPSVVQILVSGYSSTEDTDQGRMSVVIGKQRTLGSGGVGVLHGELG